MTKRPILTAHINIMVPPDVRNAVERLADAENLSIGEAARHFLMMGIENHRQAMA